ncbi:glycoside hydrolase family 92 protein [Mucilaginibacter limnophilus]|uniref:Glycoside hydrolase family 92 protein n=1 Tax=Mucilaginibacter limnophilus TaxID=1932778 RepID=A0A3S2UQJ4_9SPHI|nr:GH92 family glycosyl hydrolase [Mucilaginibacter limnophilus]RVU02038.1 glycoside hydrolase family 92 protein [Mucilaginibacter limnophilus]
MKKSLSYALSTAFIIWLLIGCGSNEKQSQTEKDFASYVNPFIGASTKAGENQTEFFPGKTYPGAVSPFGLVQVNPNTIDGGDNASGYSYEHTSIHGFSFATMSGTGWYGDLGNFLVMPTAGPMKTFGGRIEHKGEGWRSEFDKKTEKATAGYYSVVLSNYNIKAEATATPHCGMLRFTYPKSDKARVQIDLARRIGGTSVLQYVKVVDDHTITGWMKCTPEGGGWGNGDGKANYTMYFYAQFSKPLKNYGVWSADIPDGWVRKRDEVLSDAYIKKVAEASILKNIKEKEGKHLGFYTEFDTKDKEQVLMRSGISLVSMDGAKKNLEAEITDWNFDRVHNATRAAWNAQLSKISVEGGTKDEKTVFYTGLYHTMLDPRNIEDVDGNYTGGDNKVHTSPNFTKRSIFSGWDVFRSQFPLQSVINPSVVNDAINSLVELGDETGKHYLERWEFLNSYSGCMIGNPAVVVITDAYAKGIRDYNVPKAYQYAINTIERSGNGDKGFAVYCDPRNEGTGYAVSPFSISNTLEFSFDEWCMSRMAGFLGKKDDQAKYLKRSASYKNVFDKESGWFRPKNEDGTWQALPPEGRLKQFYGTVESNPYQQGWFVPHDIPGMVALMGGKQKVLADLNTFFTKAPNDFVWNDYYNHANEPVHHVPFLFNRLGEPWNTQKWTREICRSAYHNEVYGLVGNEDVGQMSAWYVLAASGFHPIAPGDTRYEITSPVFSKVVYKLDPKYAKGKTFTITAENNSPENIYIQSAKLNGKAYNHCYIDYKEITNGGTLELVMSNEPNKNWGIN